MFTVRWKSARGQTVLGLLAIPLLVVCMVSSNAYAQLAASCSDPGATTATSPACVPYHAGYYGNANTTGVPDAQLNIVNPGSTGGYSVLDGFGTTQGPLGDLCANIYVFVSDQQLTECCSCFITPNALLQFSINTNLTANPYTGTPPTAGDIKIVSSPVPAAAPVGSISATNACEFTVRAGAQTETFDLAGFGYAPHGTLLEWETHVRTSLPGLTTVTETKFHDAALSPDGTELTKLQTECHAIQGNGSGQGRCTCPAGTPQ